MNKQQLIQALAEQSSNPNNDVVITKMRGLASSVFNSRNVEEFDYKGELQSLSNWLSNSVNYNKAASLIGKSVRLNGNKEDDSQVILGGFALSLGNPIKVIEKNGVAKVVQFIPDDFASKSGISDSGMWGLGGWVALELSGEYDGNSNTSKVSKPIKLNREIGTSQEILACGTAGIKTTAQRMKQLTNEYLASDTFRDGRNKLIKWAEGVVKKNNVVGHPTKYLGVIANEISKPKVFRYEKDPLMIDKNGKLSSHEWLQTPDRSLELGVGDCDDEAIFMSSIAGLMGLGTSYRISKCNPQRKQDYSHVYSIIHYPEGTVDGYTGEQNVIVDTVYQKRMKGSGYGIEPKHYGSFDIRVI